MSSSINDVQCIIQTPRYTTNSAPKIVYRNICKTRNGRYKIVKSLKGEIIDFGTFKTRHNAVYERDLLEKYDWDYELLVESGNIKTPFTDNDLPPWPVTRKKHLWGVGGVYYVHKHTNPWTRVWQVRVKYKGHMNHFGYFNDPFSGSMVFELIRDEINKVTP
ncbi:MAG: hypothetical protein Q8S32_12155 [Burkholderiaceae bacterium]|nr:hypothetical protein [Burkholderiaceae bacterium]MDP3424501.1 hypothetical protein [Burkholderiaceae bacterium]